MLSKNKIISKEKQKLATVMIKEVWDDNFKEEIERLSLRLEKYRYIAMDTEFPGVIFQPSNTSKDQYYKSIKKNVDSLKLIQVGVTICDQEGNYPPDVTTWQFNLKFDLNSDKYSNESIALLTNSGINFEMLAKDGIPIEKFGEHMITSGLLLNEDLYWVSFHGVYDFAYLLKVITGLPLPESETLFFEHLKLYFPHYYDIRYIVRYTDNLRGSLNKLGQELNINRIGIQHQAGSDSIITSEIFFKLKSEYFSDDLIRVDKNVLFGLGTEDDDNEPYFNPGYFAGNFQFNNNFPTNIPTNPNTNKFNQSTYQNVDFANNPYYPQNVYGMQYNMVQQPRPSGSQNSTNYYPNINNISNMNTINNVNPYAFPYNQNNLNFPSYNIPIGAKVNPNNQMEEKKKFS